MDLSTFIAAIFCLIDDWLKEQRIRRRITNSPSGNRTRLG